MAVPRDPREITVYHVGGENDYGPVQAVLERMGQHVRLVVFDARRDTNDATVVEHLVRDGMPVSLVHIGIGDKVGRANFNVNKWPLSSSLLECSPLSAGEDPEYAHVHTWGENAALDHVVEVETTTIDALVEEGEVPPPDVLSLDIQGAELATFQGAVKTLTENTLCVVSEVEFFEIYRGQGLFDGQMSFLAERGFRLFDIVNQQRWHPGPRLGKGFLTVGEAISFLCVKPIPRDDRGCVSAARIDDDRLVRLAAIAYCFDALSYAVELMGMVRARNAALYEQLRGAGQYGRLVELCDLATRHAPDYRGNKNFLHGMIEYREGRFGLRAPPSLLRRLRVGL